MGSPVPLLVRGMAPLFLSILVVSCAPSVPPASGPDGGHGHAVTAVPEGAPAEVAAAAVSRCGGLGPQRKQACYDGVLLGLLESRGVGPAMEALGEVTDRDRDVKRDAHVYAHGIGIAAYAGPEQVGAIFATCTPEHQSGCYHGVVQAYFMDARRSGGEVNAEVANALCRDYRGAEDGAWLQFQCAHGMGHGLVMFHGHDLPTALKGCDLLEADFERETCYQGAFMENVVNAIMPHHPAATLTQGDAHGAGGHGGHAHHSGGGAPPGPTFQALDRSDLLYPCSVMEERYWSACYSMQTSAILHHTGRSVVRTARECERAPERMRATCFVSLGRDISGMTVQDRAASRRECARLSDTTARAWCHVGAATNMLHVTARGEDGIAYCRELPDTEDKSRCYQEVGVQLVVLAGSGPAREETCLTAEPAYVDACRRGARLTGG